MFGVPRSTHRGVPRGTLWDDHHGVHRGTSGYLRGYTSRRTSGYLGVPRGVLRGRSQGYLGVPSGIPRGSSQRVPRGTSWDTSGEIAGVRRGRRRRRRRTAGRCRCEAESRKGWRTWMGEEVDRWPEGRRRRTAGRCRCDAGKGEGLEEAEGGGAMTLRRSRGIGLEEEGYMCPASALGATAAWRSHRSARHGEQLPLTLPSWPSPWPWPSPSPWRRPCCRPSP